MAKLRIVVKIGSSSLTTANGGLSEDKLAEHASAIVKLLSLGHEVILISSGAVAAGFAHIGYPTRPVTIAGKQAAAAVGQGLLIKSYSEQFKKHGVVAAQLLLTRHSFEHKDQYQNAYATLSELIKRKALPIINENDSVSIDELTFGDNDLLSALVSGLIHAHLLIMLTDVNGIYDKNPQKDPEAKKYNFLPNISDQLLQMEAASGSRVGTGGMKSKIIAAKTALTLGVGVFIGTGSGPGKLVDVLEGKGDGTYIGRIHEAGIKHIKQWIGIHSTVAGKIEIDEGAKLALLQQGGSLLPAGITDIYGEFGAGDVVEVVNGQGQVIGKGQVHYSSEEIKQIKGLSSAKAKATLNRKQSAVIHRDYWVEA